MSTPSCDQTRNSILKGQNAPSSPPLRVDTGLPAIAAAHVVHMTETSPLSLLTQDQVADLLQIPARTLEDWRLRAYGPRFIRLGKRVRYRARDIEQWLDQLGAA